MRAKTFVLNVDPFSINKLHYRDGKIKTRDAREWECQVFHELSKQVPQDAMRELRELFDPVKHSYCVKLVCNLPEKKFFNKEGTISAKSMDLSNWEKPLIDLIFLDRYSEFAPPFGVLNLKTDDRYITSLISRKQPSVAESASILVTIKIQDLELSKRHLRTTDSKS